MAFAKLKLFCTYFYLQERERKRKRDRKKGVERKRQKERERCFKIFYGTYEKIFRSKIILEKHLSAFFRWPEKF